MSVGRERSRGGGNQQTGDEQRRTESSHCSMTRTTPPALLQSGSGRTDEKATRCSVDPTVPHDASGPSGYSNHGSSRMISVSLRGLIERSSRRGAPRPMLWALTPA
jgi:hypothetical protein